jgi:hypothetical protein
VSRGFDVVEMLIEHARDLACGWYQVRWAVGRREHCKSFATKALVDAFLATSKPGTPLDPATG